MLKRKSNVILLMALAAGIGLLFAPKKGVDTRRDLSYKLKELSKKVRK